MQSIYDAFSLLIGLIQKAEMEIVLVDGYVDVGTLNILSKKKENVAVTVYTQQRTKLSQTDVDNFNAQYPKLDVKYTRAFHDRFLILDKTKAYHVGASLKDAGKKCFGINLIEDAGIVRDILQRLELETEEQKISYAEKGVSHRNVACVFFCLERKWGRMAQVFRVERNKKFILIKKENYREHSILHRMDFELQWETQMKMRWSL